MASSKPGRQSRKRRQRARAAPAPGAHEKPVPTSARAAFSNARRSSARGPTTMYGAYGERPPNLFGGVPVSEIAILAGAVGLVVGFVTGAPVAFIVGAVVCTLGVLEVTVREHFSGYRSHTFLLAGVPSVAFETVVVLVLGEPSDRGALLLVVVPVFGVLFWQLRKRFLVARQARIARGG